MPVRANAPQCHNAGCVQTPMCPNAHVSKRPCVQTPMCPNAQMFQCSNARISKRLQVEMFVCRKPYPECMSRCPCVENHVQNAYAQTPPVCPEIHVSKRPIPKRPKSTTQGQPPPGPPYRPHADQNISVYTAAAHVQNRAGPSPNSGGIPPPKNALPSYPPMSVEPSNSRIGTPSRLARPPASLSQSPLELN